MSCIDKTYLSYEDYLILKDWCEETKLIYDNNVEGSPKDFLFSYDKSYEGEAPVWNTSENFDRWLYHNCPLTFIQERLKEQYNNPEEYFNIPITKVESGSHYTQLTKPKINFRNRKYWWIDIVGAASDNTYWYYGLDSNTWYSRGSLMPREMMSSAATIKNLTKRKLNRLIKKWELPVGTVLEISNRWIGSEYKIKVKK